MFGKKKSLSSFCRQSLPRNNPRALRAGGRYDEGSKDLGNSLTPFPKPREDNLLKTNGAYSVVRHPMYSGLAFGGFGVAILTGSPVRTIYAACLALLLNVKAATEEKYLSDMHGPEVYGEYAAKVPRLIPTVEGLGRLLEDTFDGSFSKAGKKQK